MSDLRQVLSVFISCSLLATSEFMQILCNAMLSTHSAASVSPLLLDALSPGASSALASNAEPSAASPLACDARSPSPSPSTPFSAAPHPDQSVTPLCDSPSPPLTENEALEIGHRIAGAMKMRRMSFQQLFVKADKLQEVCNQPLFALFFFFCVVLCVIAFRSP
jgi:hypothetical protein